VSEVCASWGTYAALVSAEEEPRYLPDLPLQTLGLQFSIPCPADAKTLAVETVKLKPSCIKSCDYAAKPVNIVHEVDMFDMDRALALLCVSEL